uniref:Uncharacterized protein n=1 Tax=Magallana gigas TaxID=29159 RepID=K1QXB0_MAGGI
MGQVRLTIVLFLGTFVHALVIEDPQKEQSLPAGFQRPTLKSSLDEPPSHKIGDLVPIGHGVPRIPPPPLNGPECQFRGSTEITLLVIMIRAFYHDSQRD